MQLDTGGRLGELTYCTNIHAGEQWADVHASLAEKLPRIKAQVAPDNRWAWAAYLCGDGGVVINRSGA